MLMVKTRIAPSRIAGIGLFAGQFIPKGTVVWKYQKGFDLLFSREDIEKLSGPAREQFYNYAYLDTKYNKYLLCADDARFFNHSMDFNCDERVADLTTAIRDIQEGEELTVNYKDFYGNVNDHPEIGGGA